MNKFLQATVRFLKREDGPTAVEYAVMLALIVVVCIAAITAIGSSLSSAPFAIASTAVACANPSARARKGTLAESCVTPPIVRKGLSPAGEARPPRRSRRRHGDRRGPSRPA